MTKQSRKILFYFFILAFFVITPLVTLYAAGYKYNFITRKIEKTGMLVIDSEPDNAKIYIDNKTKKTSLILTNEKTAEKNIKKTPAKIKGLLPGNYDVRIELDGYWNWQKKLTIYPGSSTFAEDVVLFKKTLPSIINSSDADIISFSENKKYALLIKNKALMTINLEKNSSNVSTLKEISSTSNEISWNDDLVLVDHTIFDTNDFSKNIDLNDFIPKKSYNIKWDPNSSDTLFYTTQNDLIVFDVQTKITKNFINANFVDFILKNEYIYAIKNYGTNSELNIYNRNTKKITRTINIPFSTKYAFVHKNNQFINLHDKLHNILYIINPDQIYNPLVETISSVKNSQWVNSTTLLFYNDFELWTYNLTEKSKTLLTRISKKITNALWHPSNNYIFYSSNGSIFTLELDDREKRNTNEILSLDSEITNMNFDKKGEILYFYSKIGNQKGLYKLSI